MEKMAVCSFAAIMMVMIGTESGMTAHAEMLIDTEEDIQAVQEMVPESYNQSVLPADAPAAAGAKARAQAGGLFYDQPPGLWLRADAAARLAGYFHRGEQHRRRQAV